MTAAERGSVILIIILVWFGVGLVQIRSGDVTLIPVYMGFSCYLIVLALPFVMRDFRPGIFHPLVFFVLWSGVKGLLTGQAALAATGLETHSSPLIRDIELNSVLAEYFLLETVALLALYAGYGFAPRFHLPVLKQKITVGVEWKSVFWIGIAGVGVIMMLRHAGSLEMLLFQRGVASTDRIASNIGGHWVWLAGIGTIVPLFWLACDATAYKRPLFWAVLASAMAFKFLTTGSRSGTVLVLIFVILVWSLRNRRISYLSIILGALSVLALVGILGEFRAATQQSRVKVLDEIALRGGIAEWANSSIQEMGSRHGQNSGELAILAVVPEKVSHIWGQSYMSMPFALIPSALVENKPRAGGKLVSDLIFNRPLTGIPPGAVGEAFWNFSYLGVVAVFAAYGAFLKLVAKIYLKNSSNPLILTGFLLVLVQLEPQSIKFFDFIQQIVPLVAIYLFANYRLSAAKPSRFQVARPSSVDNT